MTARLFRDHILWKAPPPPRRSTGPGGGGQHKKASLANDAFVAKLAAHPGRWALYASDANQGMAAPLKLRNCETTTRFTHRSESGKPLYDIYARWPEDS